MQMLNHRQVVSAVKAIGADRTIVIQGENGIGKTAIFYELCKDPFFANHIMVKPIDCTQLSDGSIWMPDIDREEGVSRELPNERFGISKHNRKGVNGARPVVIFLDEIAKCKQYIKDALAPIAYEHRNGEYEFPEGSVVFCATNLTDEGLGDSIQAHLRSRLVFLTMRKPTQPEWREWAKENGIVDELIAYTDETPQLFESFLDFNAGGTHAGQQQEKVNPYIFNPRVTQDAYVNPRSLHAASDIAKKRDEVDSVTLNAMLEGAIGAPAAQGFSAFLRFGDETPSWGDIMADPETCQIPTSPIAQIITTLKCETQVRDRDEAAKATQYIKRMRMEMQAMFCNSVSNSSKVNLFITTADFTKMLADNRIFFAKK